MNDEPKASLTSRADAVAALLKNPSPLNFDWLGTPWRLDQPVQEGDLRYAQRKKVAIIGATPSYKEAPLEDPSWEIWCCNYLWKLCRNQAGQFRADRWFELHPLTIPPQAEHEIEAMRACPVPLYVLDNTIGLPFSFPYPIDWVLEQTKGRDYFASTFAYQTALAIALGFEEIGYYGVELMGDREFLCERPNLEWWIGFAEARGVRVTIAKGSALCWHPYRYGYDYWEELEFGEGLAKHWDGQRQLVERYRETVILAGRASLGDEEAARG